MEDKILFEQAYSSHGKSFKRIQQIVSTMYIIDIVEHLKGSLSLLIILGHYLVMCKIPLKLKELQRSDWVKLSWKNSRHGHSTE